MERKEVYELIDGERAYQEIRWKEGVSPRRKQLPYEWLVFIQDYITEGMHVATRKAEPEASNEAMEIIRKIAAMGVAAMEQNGCAPRVVPEITGKESVDE